VIIHIFEKYTAFFSVWIFELTVIPIVFVHGRGDSQSSIRIERKNEVWVRCLILTYIQGETDLISAAPCVVSWRGMFLETFPAVNGLSLCGFKRDLAFLSAI